MKVLSTSYLLLLLLDGVLSVADSATETRLGLSQWTTIVLCLTSIFVFGLAVVLSFVVRFRPRWPLLVGSGLYATYFALTFVAVILGARHLPADSAAQRTRNLVVASIQIAVATACLTGLVRSTRRRVA